MHGIMKTQHTKQAGKGIKLVTKQVTKHTKQARKGTKQAGITYEKLKGCFHLPLADAADDLGVSITYLKQICRIRNVVKWPFRRLKMEARQQRGWGRARRNESSATREVYLSPLLGRWEFNTRVTLDHLVTAAALSR